jgi:hypothetical protein
MKLLLVLGAAVTALVLTATAPAAPPVQPDAVTAPVDVPFAVTELTAVQAKNLGVPRAFLPGTPTSPVVRLGGMPRTNGNCGACINTCWVVNAFHTGSNTSTGNYWENAEPVWCGNGAVITYADISRHWQTTTMWYSPDGEAGPWFDGGCVGCTSIHFTVFGYFSWHPAVISYVTHTTARLGVWLQAYGSAAYA